MLNKLRITYGKSRDAMYISQEDTVKIFTEAFIKAGLPIILTETTGYADMLFAHPLTDGYESTGEIFDIAIGEVIDTRYIVRELNKLLPSGFIAMSAEYVSSSETNINLRVYAAEYIISLDFSDKLKDKTLREKDEIRAYYKKRMELFLSQTQILVVRKSYDRMEKLDIKPQIERFKFNIDDSIDVVLSAGPRSNITPAVLLEGYMEYIGEVVNYTVKRRKIFFN